MSHPRLSLDAMCPYPPSFDRNLALWPKTGVRHAGLLTPELGDDPAAAMARLTAARVRASTAIAPTYQETHR